MTGNGLKKRVRVFLVLPSLAGGGAERVFVTLLRHLDRSRFEPILLTVDLSGPYVGLIPNDVQVIDLQAGRVRHAWFRMIREINRLKPDVVMSTMGYLNLAVLAARALLSCRPRIIVREANPPTQARRSLSCWNRNVFAVLYKLFYPHADVVITQSEGMRDDLLSYLPRLSREKVIRIYNPLDVTLIEQQTEPVYEVPQASTRKQIVAAGRLTYQKGFDLLLHAFQRLSKELPDTFLTILGEGPLELELKRLARQLGIEERVTFAGFQQNPYAYLKQAELFVLSSRWEGFPNILLEALAAGCRVVATDCPSGPREILLENQYGMLVKTEDVESLATGIRKVLRDEIRFDSGVKRARQFDAVTITKQYEQAFLGALPAESEGAP